MARWNGRPGTATATTRSSSSCGPTACCMNAIAAEEISLRRRKPHTHRRAPTRAPAGTSPMRNGRHGKPKPARPRRGSGGDGVPAYNLAVVVDDAATGVDQVVRGADLLSSSPRQAHLARLLGYPEPTYAHVPLVLNEDGARLAKRDGAVTLAEIGVDRALTQ